ncbi:hypothetical protein [Corynebacterium striatum]|uniref:hypothetical protein n=1 Tax=Corynebacterium striatum TaxID=43770 RepID=UPI003B599915
MSKWKVESDKLRYYSPPTSWDVYDPNGRFMESFDTHAEAITHADRRARTREYVLPRQPLPLSLPGIADDDALIYVTNGKNGRVYLKDEDHSETLTLYTRELRPLALALLAHAERIKA